MQLHIGVSRRRAAALAIALGALGALVLPRIGASGAVGPSSASAILRDQAGKAVGSVALEQQVGRVAIGVVVSNLPAGFHGFHIHSVGTCTGDFTSAGGHFNPANGSHPSHAGDQPVLLVNGDGYASASFATTRYRLADLFDADGSAFVIHALADNYANIPTRYSATGPDQMTLNTGDAGARIACGAAKPTPVVATASLLNAAGNALGKVTIKQAGDRLRVFVLAQGLSAGFHGFHVHTTGTCTPPDFTSAGGHLNPGGGNHPEHAGDQPLLLVNSDGTARAAFSTDRYTLADLFDTDGSAFVIHANADNYANIPTRYSATGPDQVTLNTGDAGGRTACGVIHP